ncbi:negative regulator of univalent cation permeability [Verrucomicrobiota bacterium]|nr:negative regulator of univalent cation permeability [Verrucomicrobiota bacterium]
MSPQNLARLIGVAILIFVVLIVASSGTYIVQPGFRGVEVTMGRVSPLPKRDGFGFRAPFVTTVHPVSIRQQTAQDKAECFSSDLQQVNIELRVLFRIPEAAVVKLFQEFHGEPFASLIEPRVQEALKEVTATQSAELIVKGRDLIKSRALELVRKKVGPLVEIEDIVIQNITLTRELERAIEAKMIQEQEAQRSKFVQTRAQIEADTAVIKAGGEAESIRIRGLALRENPAYLDLQVVEKWDGLVPLVIGGGGDGLVLPLSDLERLRNQKPHGSPTPQTPPALQRNIKPARP